MSDKKAVDKKTENKKSVDKKTENKKSVDKKTADVQQEKVLTKYDRKMQRRQEEKKQEQREQLVGNVVAIVVVLAMAAAVAYFPMKKYLAMHETYVTVGGEDVSRVEFDFNYNIVTDNYISQYGSYLSYFGLDINSDFSDQMYSETLTWKDSFEEMTVDDLKRTKALKAQAKAAGFSYDTSEDIAKFKENMKKDAAEAGVSVGKYVKQLYGPFATLSNISPFYGEAMYTNAYYKQISDSKAASEEEIVAYYNEHKENYDSVDYYVEMVDADLPTEPTELADPVEDTDADADAADEAYKPSEAEIAKAMEDAKKKADQIEKTVAKTGELKENVQMAAAPYLISDWLFDDARKQGDTTVIENSYGNQYYVLSFVKRYRDESATANLRVIMTQQKPGQEILNEWSAGAATEESFAELCDKYSEVGDAIGEGGLIENVTRNAISADIAEWLFAEGRTAGDTTAITSPEGYSYVIYFVGEGDPEWRNSIASTLLNNAMTAYMEEITANVTVEDKNGKLYYLQVQALENALAGTEDTQNN